MTTNVYNINYRHPFACCCPCKKKKNPLSISTPPPLRSNRAYTPKEIQDFGDLVKGAMKNETSEKTEKVFKETEK